MVEFCWALTGLDAMAKAGSTMFQFLFFFEATAHFGGVVAEVERGLYLLFFGFGPAFVCFVDSGGCEWE